MQEGLSSKPGRGTNVFLSLLGLHLAFGELRRCLGVLTVCCIADILPLKWATTLKRDNILDTTQEPSMNKEFLNSWTNFKYFLLKLLSLRLGA